MFWYHYTTVQHTRGSAAERRPQTKGQGKIANYGYVSQHAYRGAPSLTNYVFCTSKCHCADCKIFVACSDVQPTAFTNWLTIICLRNISVLTSIIDDSTIELTDFCSEYFPFLQVPLYSRGTRTKNTSVS